MGRYVTRVPMDFDWPMEKVWDGFLLPDRLHEKQCPDCHEGNGLSREATALADSFYPHQISWQDRELGERVAWHDKIGQAEVDYLLSECRLRTLVDREPTEDNPRTWEWKALPRTAAEVNAAQGPGLGSHDAINRHLLVKFRCERLGMPMNCPTCEGHGNLEVYEGQRAEAEAWEPTDPPKGDGWQLWSNTSEGSPMSPVFATGEELVDWCVPNASYFGGRHATREEWEEVVLGAKPAMVTIAPGVVMM